MENTELKKLNTPQKGYCIQFKTKKEAEMYKHYQRAAIDLECSIGSLIIEAMLAYEKKWK